MAYKPHFCASCWNCLGLRVFSRPLSALYPCYTTLSIHLTGYAALARRLLDIISDPVNHQPAVILSRYVCKCQQGFCWDVILHSTEKERMHDLSERRINGISFHASQGFNIVPIRTDLDSSIHLKCTWRPIRMCGLICCLPPLPWPKFQPINTCRQWLALLDPSSQHQILVLRGSLWSKLSCSLGCSDFVG